MRILILIVLMCALLPVSIFSQINKGDSSTFLVTESIGSKGLNSISNKYIELNNTVNRQTLKVVERMKRKEEKLRAKLQSIDGTKAQQIFAESAAKYDRFQAQLQSPIDNASNKLKAYIPGIDSLQTTMQFLSKSNLPIPADKLTQIQSITDDVQQLQGRLQQANEVQQYIRYRELQLKEQLTQYGLGKQLLGINKEVFYYQQRLTQYKELINDKKKLEQFILDKVREMPAFQSFWQRNSILAQLFPMPQNYGTPAALAGLQSRVQVQNILSQRMPGAFTPTAGGNGTNYLQQQVQQAQSQLSQLKDKVSQFGGSGASDMIMPDFKPNNQKTKSFLQRLQYGFNVQNSPSTNLLPAIADLGLTLGYKLSDKTIVGIGASYKLGLGRGFSHIAFTSQGVGSRSYIDIKAKGSIWITGGYEYNYMQQFSKLADLRKIDIWQKSALLGLTKKYRIGKNKEGNMQLLYDFLYTQVIPRGQALKFRIGYSF